MRFLWLRLINFRNYSDVQLDLDRPFTALVGSNGAGKTNILEALHYLCLTRGYSTASDAMNVRREEQFFSIIGKVRSGNDDLEIRCSYENGKKSLHLNGKECRRFADHIGKLPVVMIAPQDISLIWEAGEERRRHMDQLISQTDRSYLEDLIKYNHFLRQSNALLRDGRDGRAVDMDLLRLYLREMTDPADRISKSRTAFISGINPLLQEHYASLSDAGEQVSVCHVYDSGQLETGEQGIAENLRSGRVVSGPHRDNYEFLLQGSEIRKFGSQGQQKSFLVALKLSGLSLLAGLNDSLPLLLLDDIFDKMDDSRTRRLLGLVGKGELGQVLLTDASPARAAMRLGEAAVSHGRYEVDSGKITFHG